MGWGGCGRAGGSIASIEPRASRRAGGCRGALAGDQPGPPAAGFGGAASILHQLRGFRARRLSGPAAFGPGSFRARQLSGQTAGHRPARRAIEGLGGEPAPLEPRPPLQPSPAMQCFNRGSTAAELFSGGSELQLRPARPNRRRERAPGPRPAAHARPPFQKRNTTQLDRRLAVSSVTAARPKAVSRFGLRGSDCSPLPGAQGE